MPARALIKKDSLLHNYHSIRASLKDPHTKICLSVKANAYGHGLKQVVHALKDQRVDCFGVAHASEAQALRSYGVENDILLYSHQENSEIDMAIATKCQFIVGELEYLDELCKAAYAAQSPVVIHLKFESGMGRLGLDKNLFARAYATALDNPWLELKGLCTHFSDSSNRELTHLQMSRFTELLKTLGVDKNDYIIHCANSAATFFYPEYQFSMVRPGIALYGAVPNNDKETKDPRIQNLKPVMELQSILVSIKPYPKGWGVSYNSLYTPSQDTHIAVIGIGYGDGVPLSFSNKAQVVINGVHYPIVGRVTMDLTMIDLGNDFAKINVGRGSTVSFWGVEGLSVEGQAQSSGELNYALLTGVMERVARILV